MEILYINACVRNESRTNRLAKSYLQKMQGNVTELNLTNEMIKPLDQGLLEKRNQFVNANDFSDESFHYAKQFALADCIVIAAPYWDFSFPAILKTYFEQINVSGIIFQYQQDGSIKSFCQAKKLVYITTAGAYIIEPNTGYEYIRQLAEIFFGILDVEYHKAEGLDIEGADVESILAKTDLKL